MRADRLFSFINYSSSSNYTSMNTLIGSTAIPSGLGTTITGALNTLDIKSVQLDSSDLLSPWILNISSYPAISFTKVGKLGVATFNIKGGPINTKSKMFSWTLSKLSGLVPCNYARGCLGSAGGTMSDLEFGPYDSTVTTPNGYVTGSIAYEIN